MKIILANQSMTDELSHMLKNEQSRHGMSLQKKKQSLYHLLASIPSDSSPNASDDSAHNAAKTDKTTAYIMMIMMMIKCLFYNTYNTFGSTNDTLIKCKSLSQFELFDSHDSELL